jgi:DivIVA domain-containing protein
MNRDVKPPDGYQDDGLFQTVMFGYDREQVDEYIDAICDELHVLSSAVKRLTPIENDLLAANAEVHRLREMISANASTTGLTVRIERMLRLAEEEATALRDDARRMVDEANRDARRTVDEANQEAAEVRRAAALDCEHVAAERRREYQRLRDDVIVGAQAEAARIIAEANGRSGGLALAAKVKNGRANRATGTRGAAKDGPTKGAGGGTKSAAKKRAAKPDES